jgi:flagellar protein FliO/FliZ
VSWRRAPRHPAEHPQPAPPEKIRAMPESSTILSAVAALLAVLALIWLAGRMARFGGMARRPASGGLLVVQDVLVLDARRRLYLIRCDERRVLLLTGGTQDVVVGWLEPGDPTP